MISVHAYPLILAYSEVHELEQHLVKENKNLESITMGSSFTASARGITIFFPMEESRSKVWDLVLDSMEDEPEDE